jgi:regulator of cell morphogenesis and NO signaling
LDHLIALAEKVEEVHGTDPNAPHGLTEALRSISDELEGHIRCEEEILFPAMISGGSGDLQAPLAAIRRDHAAHRRTLDRIAAITHGFRLPGGACSLWQALYAGIRKLVADLDEHIFLENDILFPRFDQPARRGPGSGAQDAALLPMPASKFGT